MADDLKGRVAKLTEMGLVGSSPEEISRALTDINAEAVRLYPDLKDAAKKTEFINNNIVAYINKVGERFRAQVLTEGLSDALKKQIENLPAVRKEAIEKALIPLMMKHGTIDLDTFTDWSKRFQKHQDDIITSAIAAGKAPYEAMASLSTLGVMFGGIATMAGQAMDKPEWAAFGAKTMAWSTQLAQSAKTEIIKLDKEGKILRNIDRTPEEFQKDMNAALARLDVNGVKWQQAIVTMMADHPEQRDQLLKSLDRAMTELKSSHPVAGRETGDKKFVLGAYDSKILAGKVASIKAPSQYDDKLKAAATVYGLDWRELKLRMIVESGGRAVGDDGKPLRSPEGAIGLMQFMPETARGLGIDPTDPNQSIHGAAQLLAESLRKHGGRSDMIDFEYYGGADPKQWGKNTHQYVDNLKQVRAQIFGKAVMVYDIDDIKISKAKDTAVAAATPRERVVPTSATTSTKPTVKGDKTKVSSVSDEANPKFALNQPQPKGVDSRDVSHHASLAVTSTDPDDLAKRKRTTVVAQNDPKILPMPKPGGSYVA